MGVTLTVPMGVLDTSAVVSSTAGLPATLPCLVVVDNLLPTYEILAVTAVNGTVLTVGRGANNTRAQAHSIGATVLPSSSPQPNIDPQTFQRITQRKQGSPDVYGFNDPLAVNR